MARYLIRRLLQAVVVLWLLTVIVFAISRLSGSPVDLIVPLGAGPETRERLIEEFGLDQPLPTQYAKFVANAVQGDFGQSIRFQAPALELVLDRLPATLKLAAAARALPARRAKRAHPGGHDRRHQPRRARQRGRDHRADLLVARDRPAGCRVDQRPRLPRRPGRDARGSGRRGADERDRRPRLPRPRSADPREPVTDATADVEVVPPRLSGARDHVRAFARTYPAGALGGVLLLVFIALGAAASFVDGPAYDNDLVNRLQPPAWSGGSADHPLGTDSVGRDVGARIIVAIRISLLVAASSVLVAGIVGVALGLLSGFAGRRVDAVIMRTTDTMLAVPIVLLAITVMTVLEPGIRSLVLVIALTQWMAYARVVRGETLALKQQLFVVAARAVGAREVRTLRKHVLPQVLPSAIALATLNVSFVILLEAGVSFLRLRVQLPDPPLRSMPNAG